MSAVRDGEWGARMPCGHYFSLQELAKVSCCCSAAPQGLTAGQWLAVNNTCPVCRFELPSTDEEYNRVSDRDFVQDFAKGGSTEQETFISGLEKFF